MQISDIPIHSLKPYTRNPKQHDSDQVRQIAASIKAFGFNVPVLSDKNGEVIAGHGRLLAAQQLGLDTVPVIHIEHLDDDQKRAFMLADNRLNELGGGWNKELLSLELSDLVDADFDIELTGFTEDDLLDNQLAITDDDCERADEAPALTEIPITRLGDTWLLGSHKLICADATKKDAVMSFIQNDDVEIMFTDPPYGVNYDSRKNGVIMGDRTQATIPFSFSVAVEKVLNKNARIYLCGGGSN
ncbi:MAG: ParB N-terminal domain-containing protein, partial [Candidatus Thiodiazotropha sp. 6PLUC6]